MEVAIHIKGKGFAPALRGIWVDKEIDQQDSLEIEIKWAFRIYLSLHPALKQISVRNDS